MDFILALVDIVVHLDRHLPEWVALYGVWIYAILFTIIFCETGLVVTPFLPGDSLLFVVGVLTALGELNLSVILISLILAGILGNSTNYAIGRWFGKRVYGWSDGRFFKQAWLSSTEQFYARHGGKAIILARFLPIFRTYVPFVAGVSKYNFTRYQIYNVLGSALWCLSLTLAGYFFGSIPWVKNNLSTMILLVLIVSFLPIVFGFIKQKFFGKE